jgi:purine nucleoside permease
LRYDPARKALLISTGIGTNRAAGSIMALGMDPRFDLRSAYWLVAAIAGVNPHAASVGSQAWIGDIVDTDYAYAVDPREKPAQWPTGVFARGSSGPYADAPPSEYNLFALNKGLRDWAFCETRTIALRDSDTLKQLRSGYAAYPEGAKPPAVLIGDEASGQTFWHGSLTNAHVERWVSYWTGGRGKFVMTGMEDTGVAASLARLQAAGKVDAARLMVLRGGSNYTLPPAGSTAADHLLQESKGFGYSGLAAALQGAFIVGNAVVTRITGNWDTYRGNIPGGACEGKTP